METALLISNIILDALLFFVALMFLFIAILEIKHAPLMDEPKKKKTRKGGKTSKK